MKKNTRVYVKTIYLMLITAALAHCNALKSQFGDASITLTYKTEKVTAYRSLPFSIKPTIEGQIDFMTIKPPLPAGTNFDISTGEISGQIAQKINQTYTITAANSEHSTSVQLSLQIEEWQHATYFKAVRPSSYGFFGVKVAFDGNTLAVRNSDNFSGTGVIHANHPTCGDLSCLTTGSTSNKVYIYRRTNNLWAFEAYVRPPNNNESIDSIALHNDTLVITVNNDSDYDQIIHQGDASCPNFNCTQVTNSNATNSGAVYVYRRSAGGIWSIEAFIKSPIPDANDGFSQVVLWGDTLAAVSGGDDSSVGFSLAGNNAFNDNSAPDSGAIHIFSRSGSTWSYDAYLKPHIDSCTLKGPALYNNTFVIGCPTDPSQVKEIQHGNPATDSGGLDNGSALVYRKTKQDWYFESYLKAPNSNINQRFGRDIAIYGDRIAVTAPEEASLLHGVFYNGQFAENFSGPSTGAVYTFKRSGIIWSHEAYIKATFGDPATKDSSFAEWHIALSENTLAVGAQYDKLVGGDSILHGNEFSGPIAGNYVGGTGDGGVYVYNIKDNQFTLQAYLRAPNSSSVWDPLYFGEDLALSGDEIVVGAFFEAAPGNQIIHGSDLSSLGPATDFFGAVYLFKRD